MKYARFAFTPALLVACVACGQPAAQTVRDAAASQQGIVGGTTTNFYPAVGLLFNNEHGRMGDLCSGTLIDAQTVLTAAHCVLALDDTRQLQPAIAELANLQFYTGSRGVAPLDPSQLFGAAQVTLPPGFNFQAFVDRVSGGQVNDDDIALVTLTDTVGIQPIAVATAPLTPRDDGQSVVLVGYGSTGAANGKVTGYRRVTRATFQVVSPALLMAGTPSHGTCSGDSGGPMLLRGAVIGVTQAGSVDANGDCAGNDYFTRTDAWAGFLSNFSQP